MQHITSRISESVRNQDLLATERGLNLFEHLFYSEVDLRYSVAELAPRGQGLEAAFRGDEHDLLVREMHSLIDVSSGSDSRVIRSDLAVFCTKLLKRMLETRKYAEAASVSGLILHLWREISKREGHWSREDQDQLLLHVRDVCSFSFRPTVEEESSTEHWTSVCALFANLIVVAVRGNLTDAARDAFATFDEVAAGPHGSRSEAEFLLLKDATFFAVAGWILHRIDAGHIPLLSLVEDVTDRISYENFWSAVEVVLRDDPFRSALRVSWWEMEGEFVRGRASGSIQIDEFIRIAIVLYGARWPVRLGVRPTGDPRGTFQTLLNTAVALRANSTLGELVERRPHLADFEEILRGQVDEQERIRGEELARRSLNLSKVREFRSSFAEEYRSSRNIVDVLEVVLREETPGDVFGINTRIKKWWFVDQDGIYADPAALGRDLARSLRRGEESAVVDRIQSIDVSGRIGKGFLVDSLASWLRGNVGEGGFDGLIVTNSFDVMREFGARNFGLRNSGAREVNLAEFSCLLIRVYAGSEPFVAVVGRPNGVHVLTYPPRTLYGDREVFEGRLQVDVRPLRSSEVSSILSQEPDAQPDQEVVIRALEGLRIRDGEPGQTAWWSLNDDWD